MTYSARLRILTRYNKEADAEIARLLASGDESKASDLRTERRYLNECISLAQACEIILKTPAVAR